MDVTLYYYQQEAVEKMKNGCILCGGVGSGKSRTGLAYYYTQYGGKLNAGDYVKMQDPPDLYIITTARKRDTLEWENELAPFMLSTNPEYNLYSNKVVVDSWNNIEKYQKVTDSFFIFDEQRVVGSGAWVKAFLKITKVNKWILLSATPGDAWKDYIPVFVANGFYKNRTEFILEHVIYRPGYNHWQISGYMNIPKLKRLRRDILVTMKYKKKTDSTHKRISCAYDEQLYNSVVRDRWNPFEFCPIENASEYCYVLRRIVNSSNCRQMCFMDILEDAPKAIVFYNFDYELDILRKLLEGIEGLEFAEWNGHKHEKIPKSDRWVYLVQYAAGAEGWNCTETDTMIFYSQNYSYKTMVQAAGRIDRVNTPFEHLKFYHLVSDKGIDGAISRALRKKQKFNESAFVNGFEQLSLDIPEVGDVTK